MTAGAMDQFITIQRKTSVADGMGGSVVTWATHKQVWANVKAKGGRESLDEGRTNAVFVVVFTIYNLTDLTDADRIIWNGERYNIRGILREGSRAQTVKIEAERGVAS